MEEQRQEQEQEQEDRPRSPPAPLLRRGKFAIGRIGSFQMLRERLCGVCFSFQCSCPSPPKKNSKQQKHLQGGHHPKRKRVRRPITPSSGTRAPARKRYRVVIPARRGPTSSHKRQQQREQQRPPTPSWSDLRKEDSPLDETNTTEEIEVTAPHENISANLAGRTPAAQYPLDDSTAQRPGRSIATGGDETVVPDIGEDGDPLLRAPEEEERLLLDDPAPHSPRVPPATPPKTYRRQSVASEIDAKTPIIVRAAHESPPVSPEDVEEATLPEREAVTEELWEVLDLDATNTTEEFDQAFSSPPSASRGNSVRGRRGDRLAEVVEFLAGEDDFEPLLMGDLDDDTTDTTDEIDDLLTQHDQLRSSQNYQNPRKGDEEEEVEVVSPRHLTTIRAL